MLGHDDVADKQVLEVGSYDVNGSVRPYIESLNPKLYLGVDAAIGPRVDKVVNCMKLTEQVGSGWDVVISTEMLEHVRDWRGCMIQLAEAVTPGGLLLITTRSPGFPFHPYPEDHWRFTLKVMSEILTVLDFEALVQDDPEAPGVFALGRKPGRWRPEIGALDRLATEVQPVT